MSEVIGFIIDIIYIIVLILLIYFGFEFILSDFSSEGFIGVLQGIVAYGITPLLVLAVLSGLFGSAR